MLFFCFIGKGKLVKAIRFSKNMAHDSSQSLTLHNKEPLGKLTYIIASTIRQH